MFDGLLSKVGNWPRPWPRLVGVPLNVPAADMMVHLIWQNEEIR